MKKFLVASVVFNTLMALTIWRETVTIVEYRQIIRTQIEEIRHEVVLSLQLVDACQLNLDELRRSK